MSTLDQLESMFHDIHLKVAVAKFDIYSPYETATLAKPSTCQIPITTEGLTILGTPVGCHNHVMTEDFDTATPGAQLCQEITKGDDLKSSCLLLRNCHIPKFLN